jgi:putative phosphoesterase
MKLGFISDSHDNIPNLQKALQKMKKEGVKEIIHLGDLCAPFMIDELASSNMKSHIIFGNVADRALAFQKSIGMKNILHHGDEAELELGGKKLFITHFPLLAEHAALSQKYDLVAHGHTHESKNQIVGKTLLLNPGEILGRMSKPTFALYNTELNKAEIISID